MLWMRSLDLCASSLSELFQKASPCRCKPKVCKSSYAYEKYFRSHPKEGCEGINSTRGNNNSKYMHPTLAHPII
jgi:hypothetical protein